MLMAGEKGNILVLSAPSGAGKTTLAHTLLEREPRFKFSVSSTTRPQRPSEIDGQDYFFVSDEQFRAMRSQDAFLEYAQVFGHWYGTSKEHVESLLAAGHSVLLEIDWQGARRLRERNVGALTIFVLPPSTEELERRLRNRGSDTEPAILRRLADASEDMSHWHEFDYVVINNEVNSTVETILSIVAGRNTRNRADSPAICEQATQISSGYSL